MSTTVLIADDHEMFRRLARRLLEDGGYQVVGEAHDGASTVSAVATLSPDVVLLDVLLPDISGFEVARRLRRLPCAPIVLLTSSRSRADLGPGLENAEADGFVAKADLTVDGFRDVVARK